MDLNIIDNNYNRLNNLAKENKLKGTRGITLIALVITVIVLLILAGISIQMLTGDNGILNKSMEAKEKTMVAEEKEKIAMSHIAVATIEVGKVNDFQKELDSVFGNGKTEVTECGKGFDILIKDKNYYYTIDEDGKISEPQDIIEIEYSGDITKNGKYDGSSLEKAYRIECIEDLVAFSNLSENNNFEEKNIALMRDLNFKSKYSYKNWESNELGDINGIGDDGNKIILEMTTGNGFKPISRKFNGTFNGNNYSIDNIFIDRRSDRIGFFAGGAVNEAAGTVKNLKISGDITGNNYVGGISGQGLKRVENCINSTNVKGSSNVGGILGGDDFASRETIIKCINYGKINGIDHVGGIVGRNSIVEKCINYGQVIGTNNHCGGISGFSNSTSIEYSINYGEIYGNNYVAGISGQLGNEGMIKTSINNGKINGEKYVAGLTGFVWRGSYICNSYNNGNVDGIDEIGGIIGHIEKEWNGSQVSFSCYNTGKITGQINVGALIGKGTSNALNNYVKNMYYLNNSDNSGVGNLDDISNIIIKITVDELTRR